MRYVHSFLSEKSYWAKDIPLEIVKTSIENSLCVGIYKDNIQVGFSRLVTDFATFGYLADVFIDEKERGKGLSKNMMSFLFSIQELQMLRRLLLATRDAHGLYQHYQFAPLTYPDRFMELHRPNVYTAITSPQSPL